MNHMSFILQSFMRLETPMNQSEDAYSANKSRKESTRAKGSHSESLAERFLRHHNFTILEKNYRKPYGEVDLICRDGEILVFVEVKSARQPDFGPPESWVTHKKQRQIAKAAMAYLLEKKQDNIDCRFDVIAISYYEDRKPEIVHIRDAFRL